MSITTTTSLTCDIAGGRGDIAGPLSMGTVVNPASPASFQTYQLVAGNIALVLPLGYALNYLFIDANSSTAGTTLTLMGNSGDVGVEISSSLPSLIPVSNVNPFVTVFNPDADFPIPLPVGQIWLGSTAPGLLSIGWL